MSDRLLDVVILPNGSLQLEWTDTPAGVDESTRLLQGEIFALFSADPNSWLLFLGLSDPRAALSPSLDYWRGIARHFVKRLTLTPDLETLRHKVRVPIGPEELGEYAYRAPLMTGAEYLSPDLLQTAWSVLGGAFSRAIRSYAGSVEDFFRTYSPDIHLVGRVFFHLVENKSDAYPFAFMATYSTGLNEKGRSKHLPLKYALEEYRADPDKLLQLLATVHKAAGKSALLPRLIETGELFHPLAWTPGEAFSFLKEIPVYEESGILCRIPDWWKRGSPGIRLNFSVGDKPPSFVGMDALLGFSPQLLVGDTPISVTEARRLLDETEGLALIKNKWVAVDPSKLRRTLEAYEKARKIMKEQGLTLKDALRLQLAPERLAGLPADGVNRSVTHGKWLASVMGKLLAPERIASADPGKAFKAELREYQKKGLSWLCFLHSLQFGACLADDMGLGKTVQVLAFLNRLKFDREASGKPRKASLLIVPASLISNWTDEIGRFSPAIRYHIAHPGAGAAKTAEPAGDEGGPDAFDLVITTYALTQKYAWLRSHPWDYIILDEAQAIKNPGTKQARAIKQFRCRNRIVMTGTPIENRLSDLWSLFDFLNPGLLGNPQEFKRFSGTLKSDPSGYSRLRKLIGPYILRRLKTDKSVISDLPDKVEMKTYAPLSRKQIVLYADMVGALRDTVAGVGGIQRKGIILSFLVKFKQICNHPDQYLGTGGFEEGDSGKFLRLREVCETIYEKREKLLVFTQFKELTEPLREFLQGIFGRSGPVLHGSVPVSKRKGIIDAFQTGDYRAPFMVLSLKAGGVGLNLTEANHVIHFDRWWNPAVENQATDRAFRIGQKKNVVVHKFLTKGTVEEKIDRMLEEKARLAMDVIPGAGEAWITEMRDDQLMDLFTLSL